MVIGRGEGKGSTSRAGWLCVTSASRITLTMLSENHYTKLLTLSTMYAGKLSLLTDGDPTKRYLVYFIKRKSFLQVFRIFALFLGLASSVLNSKAQIT